MSNKNAASSSVFDPNANISQKNIATLSSEIHKDFNIQVNREVVSQKIESIYGKDLSEEYNRQIESHEIYIHDETSLMPYCVSISMYPFLTDGTKALGGNSDAPKHLESFCGGFLNLCFLVAAQFAGAVSTPEFLMYFDHFARKDFGDDYLETQDKFISDKLQQVVYTINEPAASRNYQSVFWNIAVFDSEYFKGMFENFYFPDGDQPNWESTKKLQTYFMQWFNKERTKKVLTFPIVTVNALNNGESFIDTEFEDMVCEELASGNSFFVYTSDSVDSLSSCCRLRNEIADNTFSYTLGAGGVATGSINVITINFNRLVHNWKNGHKFDTPLTDYITDHVAKIQKYQIAYRKLIEDYFNAGLLTVYSAGFIDLDKQFLTIGINGVVESAETLGIIPNNNEEYIGYLSEILKPIYDQNKVAHKETGYKFNTECVPAENLGIKNAAWDKKDGLHVARDCYNSYFYLPEDENTNVIDKFILHGKAATKYLDGGSALHLNLSEYLTKGGFKALLKTMVKSGCNYLGTNVLVTVCKNKDCGFINKNTEHYCTKCGSTKVSWATRVIGFLKEIPSFSEGRQHEAGLRFYHR